MKKIFYAIAALLCTQAAIAQDYNDVLRYSQFQYTGSARSVSMGSAFGALGGDFISASLNPAGLGIYRSNELSFTPSFGKIDNDALYLNKNKKDSEYKFNLSNFSYVGNFGSKAESGISRVVIGIGFNQLNNFKNHTTIKGDNAKTTLLDYYTVNANNNIWDDFNEELAWKADLMPRDTTTLEYWNDISNETDANPNRYGQSQSKTISESGKTNEWVFSVALNMNEKLNIGASLGLTNVTYNNVSEFTEWDQQGNIEYFNSYTLKKAMNVDGNGINAKVGILYRPTKSLRLGAAIHTPTFYDMHETFTSDMVNTNDYNEKIKASSPYGEYNYQITTPLRTLLSAAYSIGKIGLISVDWEHVDYSSSKLRADDYDFDFENGTIQDYLTAVNNIRIGAEIRATESVSFRAGYEMYGNPYVSTYNNATVKENSNTHNSYSAGIGYRQKSFFADFAYRLNQQKTFTQVHQGSEYAEIDSKTGLALMTIGFKF